MGYDWDGVRTRRLRYLRIAGAIASMVWLCGFAAFIGHNAYSSSVQEAAIVGTGAAEDGGLF